MFEPCTQNFYLPHIASVFNRAVYIYMYIHILKVTLHGHHHPQFARPFPMSPHLGRTQQTQQQPVATPSTNHIDHTAKCEDHHLQPGVVAPPQASSPMLPYSSAATPIQVECKETKPPHSLSSWPKKPACLMTLHPHGFPLAPL